MSVLIQTKLQKIEIALPNVFERVSYGITARETHFSFNNTNIK